MESVYVDYLFIIMNIEMRRYIIKMIKYEDWILITLHKIPEILKSNSMFSLRLIYFTSVLIRGFKPAPPDPAVYPWTTVPSQFCVCQLKKSAADPKFSTI